MTAAETSSALLRRAADRLDELAGTATPGPWVPGEKRQWSHPNVAGSVAAPNFASRDREGACHSTEDDAEWIAALGPQVAPHLSSWLRAEAEDLTWDEEQALNDCQDCQGTGEVYDGDPPPYRPSVALAYAIVGDES